MNQGFAKLTELSEQMKVDREQGFDPNPPTLTPREFVSWFGYERRGAWVVEEIRDALESCGLHTEPDFGEAGAYQQIGIFDSSASDPPADNTLRVNTLPAAKNNPTRVTPDDDLSKAKTLMAANDFSQIPVITSPREVKGIITWKSIGSSPRTDGDRVRHFMDDSVQVIEGRRPLFEAVHIIADHGYVLVRGQDNSITGIVTASDLNNQLLRLTEAFLLVGEIENHVRRIIHCRFTRSEVLDVIGEPDKDAIDGIEDLTFGGYCRLLEDPKRWNKLDLQDDRATFVKQLNEVRKIRNDVMHFNFKKPSADDIQKLRTLSPFFRSRAYPPVA